MIYRIEFFIYIYDKINTGKSKRPNRHNRPIGKEFFYIVIKSLF